MYIYIYIYNMEHHHAIHGSTLRYPLVPGTSPCSETVSAPPSPTSVGGGGKSTVAPAPKGTKGSLAARDRR